MGMKIKASKNVGASGKTLFEGREYSDVSDSDCLYLIATGKAVEVKNAATGKRVAK